MLYICVRLFAWWLLTTSATMIFKWLEGCIDFYNLFCRKPRHTTVGKMDNIREGQQYVSIASSGVKDQKEQIDVKDKNRDNISLKKGEEVEYDDDDEEEDIYVSRMWKTMATSQVQCFNL